MKTKFLVFSFLALFLSFQAIAADCPLEGDATAKTRSDPALNLLKNRETLPDRYEHITLYDLMEIAVPDGVSKKHRTLWPPETLSEIGEQEKRAVAVEGYLLGVKLEGPESPNCHSTDPAAKDFHLWLASSPDDEKSNSVVVEVTPRVRAKNPAWSIKNLKRFVTSKTKVQLAGGLCWIRNTPIRWERPEIPCGRFTL